MMTSPDQSLLVSEQLPLHASADQPGVEAPMMTPLDEPLLVSDQLPLHTSADEPSVEAPMMIPLNEPLPVSEQPPIHTSADEPGVEASRMTQMKYQVIASQGQRPQNLQESKGLAHIVASSKPNWLDIAT